MGTKDSDLPVPPPISTEGCAWIDGEYKPMSDARISVLDAGFVWSDLTYDVVGVWKGKFFRLEDHLDRFEQACRDIHLEPPMTREQMREIVTEVVRKSGLRDSYVEMIVSRGVPSPGERDPRRFQSRFYAYAIPYVWIVDQETQETGTDAIVARDVRRTPPGAINPTVKNFQWGDFIRGMFEAYDRGAWLPILTDGDGNVTEGPGFNVFVVSGGDVYTPARGVLLGITRRTAMEIAAEEDLRVVEGFLPTSMLYEAEEIFLTSTAGGVIPVATIDGERIGAACPGPISKAIRDKYWAWHDDPRFTTEVDYG